MVIDGLGRASTRLVDEVGVGEIMSPGVSSLLSCWSREGGGIRDKHYLFVALCSSQPSSLVGMQLAPADDGRNLPQMNVWTGNK